MTRKKPIYPADFLFFGGVKVVRAEPTTNLDSENVIIIHAIYADDVVGITFTRPPYMQTGQERQRGERGRFT